MAPDDLDKPLAANRTGMRWKPPVLPVMVAALAAVVVAGIAWVALVDDPLGGEPMATAAVEAPGAGTPQRPEPAALEAAAGAGNRTVTIIDGKSGARTEVTVRGDDAGAAAPRIDARLTEVSRHGAIPRVGPAGERPIDVYSRAAAGQAARKGPEIAVVVAGLGIGAGVTAEALTKLPPAVTLAFLPHGGELARWMAEARGAGHEILLQIPMEPFDYPDNDPGPQALLTSLPKAQNIDRLHWFLSRTQGYVGVANFMGARFTANEIALAPVLSEVAQRGLLYFDDGSSARSVATKIAQGGKSPFLRADLVIDARANWSDIDAALERLERLADQHGFAVGSAGALPISIDRIARWARDAEARGVRIVPLSALVSRSRQS